MALSFVFKSCYDYEIKHSYSFQIINISAISMLY